MSQLYDDIINRPHHVSAIRPRMSRENRAAQFSPFAALTGYDAAIGETGRLTDSRKEFDDNSTDILDRKLCMLAAEAVDNPKITVTHFQPDKKKKGGAYVAATGMLKRIDEYERAVVFMDGKKIAIEDILDIECETLGEMM